MKIDSAIGVFDSGMGGLSVLGDLIKYFPNENFVYYGDSKEAPYGVKTKNEVKELTFKACEYLVDKGVKIIIIACNTATSAAIKDLRNHFEIPIIGMEPAIKPAIEEWSSGDIAVMATPLTLNEEKFNILVDNISGEIDIVKVPCPELVELVENGIISGEQVRKQIVNCFHRIAADNMTAIVLGCTHYLFVENTLKKLYPNIKIYHGNFGTVSQVHRVMSSRDILATNNKFIRRCEIYSSDNKRKTIMLMRKMLNKYLLL